MRYAVKFNELIEYDVFIDEDIIAFFQISQIWMIIGL
jgi:hypothetical protein